MFHHFVFVHGASHGAWCWFKVKTLLESAGHKATCLDLKGAGINQTDPNTVFTMREYNEPLVDFLSNLSDDEKVILVGHSIGGATVTDAISRFANKISMAIYVAAFMLKPMSTLKEVKDMYLGVPDFGIWEYIYGLGADQEPTGMIMKKEYQRKKYYNESPQEDYELASMLLRPAPYRALQGVETDLPPTPSDIIDSVPRVYIKTLQDHMFDPNLQELMVLFWPPSQQYSLKSDHCAFFSNPTLLFHYLLMAAASIKSDS